MSTKRFSRFSMLVAILSGMNFAGGGGKSSLQAQTFLVQNLHLSAVSTTEVEPGYWSASSFTTGSSATSLEGMVTRIASNSFSGSPEFISIYSNSSTNSPGSRVFTFQDNPTNIGSDRFQFAPNGNVELAANTTYWMVFGTGSTGSFTHYWAGSGDEMGITGWSIGDTIYTSFDDGVNWNLNSNNAALQFGIVPEPSTYALAMGVMLIAFVAFRRMHCVH